MNIKDQIDLIISSLEIIERKKELPEHSTYKIPASRYISSQQLEAEKEKVFQNFPIVVGSANALENVGDYLLHDYSGIPILVVKGKDEKVRAFHNICRHRGVRLLSEKTGHIRKNIICPYHAWSYDLTGCLTRIFHPEGFDNVSAETHSLIELDCQVRMGLIFVVPNVKLKGKFNIDEYLKETKRIVEGFGLEHWIPFKTEVKTNPFNWKLGIEAGMESYHFKIAHAATLGPYLFDCGGVEIPENKLHLTYFIPKTSILKLKSQPKEQWNLTKVGNLLLHIFPNTTFLIMEDHAMVIPSFPLDEKSSIAESFMLIPKATLSKGEKEHYNRNYNIFWTTIDEDNEMTCLQQESFNLNKDISITVGSYENLIFQFEELIQKVIHGSINLIDFK